MTSVVGEDLVRGMRSAQRSPEASTLTLKAESEDGESCGSARRGKKRERGSTEGDQELFWGLVRGGQDLVPVTHYTCHSTPSSPPCRVQTERSV